MFLANFEPKFQKKFFLRPKCSDMKVPFIDIYRVNLTIKGVQQLCAKVELNLFYSQETSKSRQVGYTTSHTICLPELLMKHEAASIHLLYKTTLGIDAAVLLRRYFNRRQLRSPFSYESTTYFAVNLQSTTKNTSMV